MVKFKFPKMYSIDEFLKMHPEFPEKGIVAMFPNLIERDNEEKREWLQNTLIEGHNGSSKPTWDFMIFCTSGDAMVLMKSAEKAKELENRSPLFKNGTEVTFESWSDSLRVRLQYRGAFNRVMDVEEVEY